jgi:beta-N-acetylhexosaminidase
VTRAAIRRRRLVAGGLVAVAAVILAVVLSAGEDETRPLPEGGSSFGARTAEKARGGTLLDALAPLLTPRVVVAGTSASSASRGRTGAATPGLPLPLDRAAAQLFLVGFEGENPSAPFFERLAVRDWGGVLLDRANYVEPGQLATLAGSATAVARDAGHAAPVVAARQLGGDDSAFKNLPPKAQPETPTAAAAATQAGLAGRQLRALGIHMTLAPAADLAVSGGAWEGRAFSDQPGVVARLARAAVAGYTRARVASAPGHFPGEGAASQDPAEGAATVGLAVEQLRAQDMRPFAAIARRAPAITMSNALYAGFDGVTPATLLPQAVALLRGLGFRGVVVSGDLSAVTLATGGSVGEAAVEALKAGCDLLHVPGGADDQEDAWAAVVRAVRRGEVPIVRVASALRRIAALKRRFAVG